MTHCRHNLLRINLNKSICSTFVLGNVGAGKSTLVDILTGEDGRISGVPEPVAVWQNFSGTGVNLLELMFNDGPRWAGTFQLVSTLSRFFSSFYTNIAR